MPSEIELDRLNELLQIEEAATLEREAEKREGKSAKRLEQEGLLVRGAIVVEESSALFGRWKLIVRDDPSRPGHLSQFLGRPGSIVRLGGQSGIITRVGRGQIHLIFEEEPEIEGNHVDFTLSSDSV